MKAQDSPGSNSRDKLAFRIAWLIAGYLGETLTQQEHVELDDWVTASIDNQKLFEELTDPSNVDYWLLWKDRLPVDEVLDRLKKRMAFTPESRRKRVLLRRPLLVAASIAAIILVSLLFFWAISSHRQLQPTTKLVRADISP